MHACMGFRKNCLVVPKAANVKIHWLPTLSGQLKHNQRDVLVCECECVLLCILHPETVVFILTTKTKVPFANTTKFGSAQLKCILYEHT